MVEGADIVTPDGMPLVKALRLLYGIRQERVAGMDLMPGLLAEAEAKELAVFLYGSTEEVMGRVIDRALAEHPRLRIAGRIAGPSGR